MLEFKLREGKRENNWRVSSDTAWGINRIITELQKLSYGYFLYQLCQSVESFLGASRSEDRTGGDVSNGALVIEEQISVRVFSISLRSRSASWVFCRVFPQKLSSHPLTPSSDLWKNGDFLIFCFKLKKRVEIFAHGSPVSSRDYSITLKRHLNQKCEAGSK